MVSNFFIDSSPLVDLCLLALMSQTVRAFAFRISLRSPPPSARRLLAIRALKLTLTKPDNRKVAKQNVFRNNCIKTSLRRGCIKVKVGFLAATRLLSTILRFGMVIIASSSFASCRLKTHSASSEWRSLAIQKYDSIGGLLKSCRDFGVRVADARRSRQAARLGFLLRVISLTTDRGSIWCNRGEDER